MVAARPRPAHDRFADLVSFAIDERVDFVVAAGDLYDGDWQDWRTGQYGTGAGERVTSRRWCRTRPTSCSATSTAGRARYARGYRLTPLGEAAVSSCGPAKLERSASA
jgi:hypothetical protein